MPPKKPTNSKPSLTNAFRTRLFVSKSEKSEPLVESYHPSDSHIGSHPHSNETKLLIQEIQHHNRQKQIGYAEKILRNSKVPNEHNNLEHYQLQNERHNILDHNELYNRVREHNQMSHEDALGHLYAYKKV